MALGLLLFVHLQTIKGDGIATQILREQESHFMGKLSIKF